jgi:hypothetical protein
MGVVKMVLLSDMLKEQFAIKLVLTLILIFSQRRSVITIWNILPILLILPIIVAIVFLINWFALWFKPIHILLLGVQLSITGIFMLVLWLVLNKTGDVYYYNWLAYSAVALAIVGFLLSCSFAFRKH